MVNKILASIGILGAVLFVGSSILGGFQFDNYNPISQYISESYATGSPYGKSLRFFGYIPSGVLFSIFSIFAIKKFPKSIFITLGFLGLVIFYGIATIIVGIFPCDVGCNKEWINPSISQMIHNASGLLTYTFVPFSILMIAIGLRAFEPYRRLSNIAFICGGISIFFVGILSTNPISNIAGLLQRIIEGAFIIWIISCSLAIFNHKKVHSL